MSWESWPRWKVLAVGAAVVVTMAVVTAGVVANWTGRERPVQGQTPATAATSKRQGAPTPAAGVKPPRQVASAPSASTSPAPVTSRQATPSPADIQACNETAKAAAKPTTGEVVEKAVIGGVLGAGVGAAGGAIAGGGKGAGKGAAIGGIVGVTAGTLYGLSASNQNDARAVEAYRTCMRQRGHVE